MIGSFVTGDARRELDAASTFFLRHVTRLSEAAEVGPVLDLACGRGRHSLAAADLGMRVIAVDRNSDALDQLARASTECSGEITTLTADLETLPLPDLPELAADTFGAVLVFRYLHRPLARWIESRLAVGGILLYETFTTRQRNLGWGPTRDEFLLRAGELPSLFPELEVEVHEEGLTQETRPAETARLLAIRRA